MTAEPSGNPAGASRDPAAVLAASTFSAGVILLPADLRGEAKRLYYLLRTIDDLVDEHDPRAEERVEALEAWASSGETESPEAIEMASLSDRHEMPPTAVLDFCAGMRHDIEEKPMPSGEALDLYCHQVAGTVGLMLTALFGTSERECAKRMEQLGRAMQLTNILRDIDEDRANGRSYVPQSMVARYGPPLPGRRAKLMRHLIARADELYEEGLAAIPLLPRGGRAMYVSTVLYRETLRQIEREGFGRRSGRPCVPRRRREQLMACATRQAGLWETSGTQRLTDK